MRIIKFMIVFLIALTQTASAAFDIDNYGNTILIVKDFSA